MFAFRTSIVRCLSMVFLLSSLDARRLTVAIATAFAIVLSTAGSVAAVDNGPPPLGDSATMDELKRAGYACVWAGGNYYYCSKDGSSSYVCEDDNCKRLDSSGVSGVSGVQVVQSQPSASSSQSPKKAIVYCPAGKQVIGGGGKISDFGATPWKPALTQLQPVRLYDGARDAYVVTAAETPPGTTTNWQVQAYAVCANPLPGLHIVSVSTTPSSSSVQATAASCSGGWVIGTGGKISTASGNVVLQVARPDIRGGIARVQAHEVATGYTGTWSVTSYAVCVPTQPAGYEVVFGESQARLSEAVKSAGASCSAGKRLLSLGAAITNTAPGNVSLYAIFPGGTGQQTVARAVENTLTSQNWDFIVATAVCAY